MDEILKHAVLKVLASTRENKEALLEEMLGSEWATMLEAEGLQWKS